ncbi:MAG: hypothetical protein ACTSSE_18820 [Candidatus Thorarchaeota archaeon]
MTLTQEQAEELTPEEFSEFLIDGEIVEDERETVLVFDDCEQMIEVRL